MSGDSICGIGSTQLSQSGSTVTLNPLGVNGATNFTIVGGEQADSVSSNLTILSAPGHDCSISTFSLPPGEFFVVCQRPGASCAELFIQ